MSVARIQDMMKSSPAMKEFVENLAVLNFAYTDILQLSKDEPKVSEIDPRDPIPWSDLYKTMSNPQSSQLVISVCMTKMRDLIDEFIEARKLEFSRKEDDV